MANTKTNKKHSAKWNAVVKAIREKYPEMSDRAVYVRARYACAK